MAKLKKEISLFTAVLYGVGIILGAGIYVLIGKAAGIAGDSFWLSFGVASIIAAFTGLSYAELSSMFPKNAAEYVYTKKAFNKNYISFIVQWIMIFTLIVSAATVALGFGGYASHLLGGGPVLLALLLVIGLSLINYIGIKESTEFNIISTIIEIAGLVIVIVIGFFFFGNAKVDFLEFQGGIESVMLGTALIFFAYIGFEELVNMSEETKNANKVIPKALIIALIISTVLYMLVSVASLTVLGSEALASSNAPLTDVVHAAIPEASLLMSIIALFATANTVLVIMIVASRMLYGLSRNNVMPSILGKVGKRGTPTVSIFITMIVVGALLFVGNIQTIALLTDIGIFLVYVFVNAALIWLRYKQPNVKRGFRSPVNIGKFPVLALLGIISSGLMFLYFEPILILYEIVVVLAGFGVFYFYTYIKSHKHFSEKHLHYLRSNKLLKKVKKIKK